jgi:hypothetical protein
MSKENPIIKLINKQSEDEELWFIADYVTEDYLQSALRKLHSVCEDYFKEQG